MKVLVLSHTGINNGPVMKTLLSQKGHETKAVAASDKHSNRHTTRKFKKAAKEALQLDVESVQGTPVTAEDLAWADVIVAENKNNVSMVKRRLGKESLENKTLHVLGVKSGFRCHAGEECITMVNDLHNKINELSL